jgi:hypothetical protein
MGPLLAGTSLLNFLGGTHQQGLLSQNRHETHRRARKKVTPPVDVSPGSGGRRVKLRSEKITAWFEEGLGLRGDQHPPFLYVALVYRLVGVPVVAQVHHPVPSIAGWGSSDFM